MVSLGVTMLLVPELLETVMGTVLVFGTTACLIGLVLLTDHLLTTRRAHA